MSGERCGNSAGGHNIAFCIPTVASSSLRKAPLVKVDYGYFSSLRKASLVKVDYLEKFDWLVKKVPNDKILDYLEMSLIWYNAAPSLNFPTGLGL